MEFSQKLSIAIEEADRFLKKAKVARAKCETKQYEYDGKMNRYEVADGPSSAAAKRASMDLTRALADLRRSR